MFVWEKLKHFGKSLNSFRNELDPAEHTKERPWREMNFKELQEYWQENRHKGKFPVVLRGLYLLYSNACVYWMSLFDN